VRFFNAICDRIGIAPEHCCMVGDRLGYDIYPANLLRMRTIWMKVGPHAIQQPRVPEDVPDASISELAELPPMLDKWRKGSGSNSFRMDHKQ
jgi:FMN phosphatase YigB (HAD superfamily)